MPFPIPHLSLLSPTPTWNLFFKPVSCIEQESKCRLTIMMMLTWILPKVRYGQIKRKLGLDNWNAANKVKEAKDGGDAAGNNGGGPAVPQTPATTGRTRRTLATPSTPAASTGAGVKKRGGASTGRRTATTASSGGGRRKTRAQAAEAMEDGQGDDGGDDDDDDDDDDDLMLVDSPTPNTGARARGAAAAAIKSEFGAASAGQEFANFPEVLPAEVLERQAILINNAGRWTAVRVSSDIHVNWLSRLPGDLQARFYAQAHQANKNNNNKNKNNNNNTSYISIDSDDNEAGAMPMQVPADMAAQMGYAGAAAGASGHGNADHGQQHVDLHSIPMHPAYLERLQREQEARDSEVLFGVGAGIGVGEDDGGRGGAGDGDGGDGAADGDSLVNWEV